MRRALPILLCALAVLVLLRLTGPERGGETTGERGAALAPGAESAVASLASPEDPVVASPPVSTRTDGWAAPSSGGRDGVDTEAETIGVGRITGRLQLRDGTPLEGYRVQLIPLDGTANGTAKGTGGGARWTESGPNGAFAFNGLEEGGRFSARLWLKYGAPSEHEPAALVVPAGEVTVNVDAILVRATWPADVDRPEPGAAVEVAVRPFGLETPSFGAVIELEAAHESGSIERLLASGPGYIVSARAGDQLPGAFVVPVGREPGLFLGELDEVGPELGAVEIEVDGELPQGTRLDARFDAVEESFSMPVPRLGVLAQVRAGRSGQRVPGLLAGQYRVTVSMGGRSPYGHVLPELDVQEITIEASALERLPVRLVPAGLIEVTVEAPSELVTDKDVFQIQFLTPGDPDWRMLVVAAPEGGPPRGAIPVGTPHLTSETLRAGALILRAFAPGWSSPEVAVDVVAGETTRATIRVER